MAQRTYRTCRTCRTHTHSTPPPPVPASKSKIEKVKRARSLPSSDTKWYMAIRYSAKLICPDMSPSKSRKTRRRNISCSSPSRVMMTNSSTVTTPSLSTS